MLPEDVPVALVSLLALWRDISIRRIPTLDDLVFDDLLGAHPGLFLVDPVQNCDDRFDLKLRRTGPELAKRIGQNLDGALASQTLGPHFTDRLARIVPQMIETGEPIFGK